MRLGVFGGTFDPIHLGHLILAEWCREACELDEVWFVVAGAPPHKPPGGRTPVADRLEMVRIAVAGNPAFSVSEIEAHTPGPHYSVQTLETIRLARPDDDLFFLIGGDSLVDLPGWRQPGRIAELATLVAVNRPGADLPPTPPGLGPGDRPIVHVSIPPIGIASSDLRRRMGQGKGIRYQVPRGVEAYIHAHRLYGVGR
ncbi:nicotinate-nucleotide adenylyltransferase [Isosphaeraceae bacterium EP7]